MSAAAATAGRLRSALLPELPRDVWVVQAGMLVNSIGTGVVMPFLIIYLHDVRGFALATAGLVAGSFGIVSLGATMGSGPVIDRVGDRSVFAASLILLALGYALLATVRAPWEGVACLAVAGIGNGSLWPAQSVLMLRVVPPERRHVAFSVNRMMGNLGLGIGVLLGGALVAGGATGRFELLFGLDGASFALFALCVLALPRAAPRERRRPAAGGSYAQVLRDRTYLGVVAANVLFVAAGYAQLEVGLPYFAKHQAHLGPLAIGALFVANTAAVVVLQMPVSRAIEGKRRTRTLALAAVVWACAFALAPLAAVVGSTALAAVVLLAVAAGIGLAECLHTGTMSPLAADLAPESLRGRYMALVTASFAIGFTAGPALAGAVLGASPLALWPIAALGCLVAGGIALALERRLPAAALVTPVR